MFSARTILLLAATVLAAPSAAQAQLKAAIGDWPAWMGADRTGVSSETGLLKKWPQDGPKLLWKVTDIGDGYSTPSVVGDKIYLLSNRGTRDEFALALSVPDGKSLWSKRLGSVGNPNQRPPYPGSRSTPTVDGDAVYVLGSDGDLACLDAAKGAVRWKKSLRTDFGGKPGVWAYAESPLIDGDVLICTPGGEQATLVALNKKNGELIWKASVPSDKPSDNTAAYASPIVATVGSVKQYIQFLGGGMVGVAAKDGKLLWRYNKVTGTTNCTTPLFHDDCVFVSAINRRGTGSGGALVRLTADGDGVSAREVYLIKELANHHGGVVRVGDALYGTNNTSLVCIDFKTGATKWENRSVGKGSVTAADGRLYVRSEDGPIALVEATPNGYKEISRFEQPNRSKKKSWPHPVVAGGRLYLRDQDVLLCYDVKAK
ncbi:MAG TPA: PQQ-binding-like beta-propeller repeat protein [Gemmataceae bacterium]|jgi:outer membrane protein assembly factor BamB